jgi:hypothetical protein
MMLLANSCTEGFSEQCCSQQMARLNLCRRLGQVYIDYLWDVEFPGKTCPDLQPSGINQQHL